MENYFDLGMLIKEASNQSIQGPAVDSLIKSVKYMYGRGAPTDWDAQGFNKIDYSGQTAQSIASIPMGSPMPINLAVNGIRMLEKYRKQLPNVPALKMGIEQLILQLQGREVLTDTVEDDKKVTLEGSLVWGQQLFKIRGLTPHNANIIKKNIAEEMAKGGDAREVWKIFGPSTKSGVDIWMVDPKYISIVKNNLDSFGYDTQGMSGNSINAVQGNQGNQSSKLPIQNVEMNSANRSLTIVLGSFNQEFVNLVKTLPPNNRSYEPNSKGWIIYGITPDFLNKIISTLEPTHDTSKLKAIIPQIEGQAQQPTQEDDLAKLQVENVSTKTNNAWHLAFKYGGIPFEKSKVMSEIIKFMFPQYDMSGKGNGQRFYDKASKVYYTKGEYNQYRQVSGVLKKYGLDPTEFNKAVSQLIAEGIIETTRIEGDLDGYQTEKTFTDGMGNQRTTKVNNPEAFKSELDTYKRTFKKDGKDVNFELYDLQKDGVAFLYGRQSALLGDDTGVGKTVQLIIAADMRMKQSGGSTVVITLNSTQQQWANEIGRFAKIDPTDVSLDSGNIRKWNVLTYTDFQVPSTRDTVVNQLKAQVKMGTITCLILDECHSIKNSGSARTENIQSISSFEDSGQTYKIPFVWGASATMVANKPVDVYNQLKAINHPLGRLSYKTFAKEFGAMSQGKYGLEDADIAEQVKAANRLKEWLINFGVFTAKSKKDIREDMPDHNISELPVEIDMNQVYSCTSQMMQNYKDPNLAVSAMIAMRACLAQAKVAHSVQEAEKILKAGKKVMIFTGFKEASNDLRIKLQQVLNDIGQGGEVLAIVGGMRSKTREKVISDFKNPNSTAKALVVSLIAGGTGLDFPNVVEDVIMNDFDWTPAVAEQSEGRAYRINSEKTVNTRYIVAKDSPDAEFKERVNTKRIVAEAISKLTKEQLKLFSLGESTKSSKQLQEIEQKLIQAVEQQVKQEEGEKDFQNRMANDILSNIRNQGGNTPKQAGSGNWYKKVKNGDR